MEEQPKTVSVASRIYDLRNEIMKEESTNENRRIKAIINTKLQEAELFARELYNKEA